MFFANEPPMPGMPLPLKLLIISLAIVFVAMLLFFLVFILPKTKPAQIVANYCVEHLWTNLLMGGILGLLSLFCAVVGFIRVNSASGWSAVGYFWTGVLFSLVSALMVITTILIYPPDEALAKNVG